jgi:hypothetical protein
LHFATLFLSQNRKTQGNTIKDKKKKIRTTRQWS